MYKFHLLLTDRISDNLNHHIHTQSDQSSSFVIGGLFLEQSVPHSFLNIVTPKCNKSNPNFSLRLRRRSRNNIQFLCVSLSDDGFVADSKDCILRSEEVENGEEMVVESSSSSSTCRKSSSKVGVRGGRAINTTKHLWAGAIAAMVSGYSILE